MEDIVLSGMITPEYSVYDLFRDIEMGEREAFYYDGEFFAVEKIFKGWRVKHLKTGFEAISFERVDAMIGFQGVAACLLFYGKNMVISGRGEILFSGEQFLNYFPPSK